jgi:hypothetical protein
MFHEGDIVELVNSSKSNILNRPGVSIGSLFVVKRPRLAGNSYIWIDVLRSDGTKYRNAGFYSSCFKLVARKTKFGYIMI